MCLCTRVAPCDPRSPAYLSNSAESTRTVEGRGGRVRSALNELAAEEERDGGKVNNRWLKHVAAIRSSRRSASPPPASWEVTTQRRPWRHGVRDQVPPWWQPIMPDCHVHAVPDWASWDIHTHIYTVRVCTVLNSVFFGLSLAVMTVEPSSVHP